MIRGSGSTVRIVLPHESYRPMIRGKKWYWQLSLNMVNVAMMATWRIRCRVDPDKLSHLEFQRHVTLCLLKDDVHHPRTPGGAASLPEDVRYDGMNHILGSTAQSRCKFCQKKNTKNMCKKCNVSLHAERGRQYFEMYHCR